MYFVAYIQESLGNKHKILEAISTAIDLELVGEGAADHGNFGTDQVVAGNRSVADGQIGAGNGSVVDGQFGDGNRSDSENIPPGFKVRKVSEINSMGESIEQFSLSQTLAKKEENNGGHSFSFRDCTNFTIKFSK